MSILCSNSMLNRFVVPKYEVPNFFAYKMGHFLSVQLISEEAKIIFPKNMIGTVLEN